jgi:hypothetical protein
VGDVDSTYYRHLFFCIKLAARRWLRNNTALFRGLFAGNVRTSVAFGYLKNGFVMRFGEDFWWE